MQRRTFFRHLGALGVTAAATRVNPSLLVRDARAANTSHTLVVLFLRGACDGLNAIVPYGEDAYYRARPGIGIAAPGNGAESALDIDGFFGFHPSLRSLAQRYWQGQVAILPAVHHVDAPRSHFDAQDVLEQAGGGAGSGWLNRYLEQVTAPGALGGLAIGPHAPLALQGGFPASAIDSLDRTGLSKDPQEEALLLDVLRPHYQANPGDDVLSKVKMAGALAISDLEFLRSFAVADIPVTQGVNYPETPLGSRLADLARLLKSDVGLEVATLDMGGWDTHRAQGGGSPTARQSRLLADLAESLDAFHADLGARASDVTTLVMTEFGRTLGQNGSGGTDHGNAGCWFAVGSGVRGGLYLGSQGWPGLEEHQLREGRDLMHTIEYRDVMAECLTRWLGLSGAQLATVLPGGAVTPIGFLG